MQTRPEKGVGKVRIQVWPKAEKCPNCFLMVIGLFRLRTLKVANPTWTLSEPDLAGEQLFPVGKSKKVPRTRFCKSGKHPF